MTKLLYRIVIAAIAGEDGKLKSLYERYTKESRLHVSIGEILRERQPETYYPLAYLAAEDREARREVAAAFDADIGERLGLIAAWLTDHQRRIARIMEEPPRPGRGE